jgi:hypothetical protein
VSHRKIVRHIVITGYGKLNGSNLVWPRYNSHTMFHKGRSAGSEVTQTAW